MNGLSHNWEIINLGDAATFVNGYAFKPEDWSDEGLEIIRIQNLTKGNSSTNYFKGEIPNKYRVICGDLLISWSATLGIYTWKLGDAWLNQHIFKVVFDKKEFDKQFFKYLIGNSLRKMGEQVHGATMKHITKKKFDAFSVPYPPLAEQQKIAAILDAADSLRQKDQQLIEHYTALSQSLFLEMFGDPVCNPKKFPIFKLSEAYINTKEGTKCGPFGSALKKEEYTEKGIPVWVMDNIQGHNFVYKKCLFITNEKFLSLNNYLTQSGDIIISRAGTVGKMCVIPDCYNKAIISTNLIRLRLNIKVLLPLFFVLLMKYFTDRIGRIKTGPDGAFTHMNTGVLNDLTFPFPPITLQNQFAEKIQAIEAQKQQAQASLEKSETLFNSLLQRAFKGELTT